MSTRSGKRLHGSINENIVDDSKDLKIEKKGRGKRQKENYDEIAAEKKRKHYVRYPSQEDVAVLNNGEKLRKNTRKSSKNTLKEQNIATESETLNGDKKCRRTLRVRNTDAIDFTEITETDIAVTAKAKGNKRKAKQVADENAAPVLKLAKKKTNKKKKGKSGSLVVEDVTKAADDIKYASNMSIDSFHSAAGSPVKGLTEKADFEIQIVPSLAAINSKNHERHIDSDDVPCSTPPKYTSKMHRNIILEKSDPIITDTNKKNKRRVTSGKCSNVSQTQNTDDALQVHIINPNRQDPDNNIGTDNQPADTYRVSSGLNNSLDNSKRKRSRNSRSDKLSFDAKAIISSETPDKLPKYDQPNDNSVKKNSTYDKIDVSVTNLNNTFDKEVLNDSQATNSINIFGNNKKEKRCYDIVKDSNLTSDEIVTNTSDSQVVSTNAIKSRNKTKKSSIFKMNEPKTNVNVSFADKVSDLNKSDKSQDILTNTRRRQNTSSTYDIIDVSNSHLNTTFDKEIDNTLPNDSDRTNENDVKDKNKNKRMSTRKSITNEVNDTSIINLDATYQKDNSSLLEQNNTQENEKRLQRFSKYSLDQDGSTNFNTTYDKNSTNEIQPEVHCNTTFEKSPKVNTTFEIARRNSTFDRSQNGSRRGSSLISSDTMDSASANNVTSDSSKHVSCISITSDESMAENIGNTTPVVVESSMDESQITVGSNERNKTPMVKQTRNATPTSKDIKGLIERDTEMTFNICTQSEENITETKTPKTMLKHVAPLNEEGTFTETEGPSTPKGDKSFVENVGTHTPKREGTYTELTKTPLKREGTYTELNPISTPKNSKYDLEMKQKTPKPLNTTPAKPNRLVDSQPTLFKREGTFTKEDSIVLESPKKNVDKTPTRRKSLPSPGRTPFVASKEVKKSVLNITRSMEKLRRSSVDVPKATRVAFCSPLDTPAVAAQHKGRIIKSNLKGSDKSFIFEDARGSARKRSYTHSEAETLSSKRKRLTEGQQPAGRLPRPRTASASGKLQEPSTPSKRTSTAVTSKAKTELTSSKSKPALQRTKLPNFAALHQKQFSKMESLDECQERKAKRARQLLTPTGSVNVLERVSPKDQTTEQPQVKKLDTPKKLTPQQGYTKFGFKLNLDVNPFSISSKPEIKGSVPLKRQATLPSLAGATIARRELAKQTVMREKSFSEKRDAKRQETRTIIKGVRTNRRFELQMKMRNC